MLDDSITITVPATYLQDTSDLNRIYTELKTTRREQEDNNNARTLDARSLTALLATEGTIFAWGPNSTIGWILIFAAMLTYVSPMAYKAYEHNKRISVGVVSEPDKAFLQQRGISVDRITLPELLFILGEVLAEAPPRATQTNLTSVVVVDSKGGRQINPHMMASSSTTTQNIASAELRPVAEPADTSTTTSSTSSTVPRVTETSNTPR